MPFLKIIPFLQYGAGWAANKVAPSMARPGGGEDGRGEGD
jgi:hypothetical protein